MGTFRRYMLFQIPGLVLVVTLGLLGQVTWDLPVWVAPGLFCLWLLKDLALYPLVRRSYAKRPATDGADRMVGAKGVVTERLAPEGWVRVAGELWRARTAGEVLDAGRVVEVAAVESMVLVVTVSRSRRPS